MAHLAGKGGQVMATGAGSATETAGIKSWTLDYTVDVLETTDFADAGVKTYVMGCSGWSGTFEGLKEGAPVWPSDTAITLTLEESSTGTQQWIGSAFITGCSATTAMDGIVSYSYTFQGTGVISTKPTT